MTCSHRMEISPRPSTPPIGSSSSILVVVQALACPAGEKNLGRQRCAGRSSRAGRLMWRLCRVRLLRSLASVPADGDGVPGPLRYACPTGTWRTCWPSTAVAVHGIEVELRGVDDEVVIKVLRVRQRVQQSAAPGSGTPRSAAGLRSALRRTRHLGRAGCACKGPARPSGCRPRAGPEPSGDCGHGESGCCQVVAFRRTTGLVGGLGLTDGGGRTAESRSEGANGCAEAA